MENRRMIFMLYLNVPFEEKDEAKRRYAKWDSKRKQWYATNPKYYFRFKEWIVGESVAQNKVYIAYAPKKCWKCGKDSPIYAFAVKIEDIIDISDNMPDDINMDNISEVYDYIGSDMAIIPINKNLPDEIINYLVEHTACKITYSNTIKESYFANICEYCSALQGNHYVYSEVDSPFFAGSDNMELVEFELKNDIAIDYELGESIQYPFVSYFNIHNVKRSGILIE